MYGLSDFLLGDLERTPCEAVKAKPKLQWRPQNIGHVRTIRFTRKAVGTVWSWLKRAGQEVRRMTEGCWNTKTIRSSRCWTWN